MLHKIIISVIVMCAAMNFVFAETNSQGKKYAIIIAVSQYDDEKFSLPMTANDAVSLANTLHQRGGFEIIPLFESREKGVGSLEKTIPTKANIISECQRVLENCVPGDTVFLYFSGHGIPHPKEPSKTYLLPKDVSTKQIPESLLETAWLRDQLSRCKASTKFLMLDACHAGGEKSAETVTAAETLTPDISSHEIIDGEMEGVVTLASCTKNQKSYFWEEKEMSLFSYWLNEGLKGNADMNGDGEISFNELDEYVNKNVTLTAKEIKNVNQTPIRIIRSDVSGVPVVMKPRAVSLDLLLDDLAEQITAAMRIHNVKRTGVLEFTTESGERTLDRTKYGTLAAYCAEQLEERIKYRLPRRDGFKIVAREAIEKALKDKGIGSDDLLANTISEAKITFGDKPMESYVVGTIESQHGAQVRFRCSLVSVDNIEKLNTPRGTAILSESEWAMLGRNAAIPPEVPQELLEEEPISVVQANINVTNPVDYLPSPQNPRADYKPPVTESLKPIRVARVAWIDTMAQKTPNPLTISKRPIDAGIEIKNANGTFTKKSLVFKENDAFVPLQQGDVYRIFVRNNEKNTIAARILVDGLNTLPQKLERVIDKFQAIEELDDTPKPPTAEPPVEPPAELTGTSEIVIEEVEEMAPRVNLETARFWLLPPQTNCNIPGFFEKVGSNAIGREFRVTEAPNALATQKDFTDQIGIITIAYYSTKAIDPATRGRRKPGSFGTEAGEMFRANVRVRNDLEIDELLGVIQIRYGE
ncbi:MAG: caspase family protein [Thermoguttaceae bacterium]